MRIWDSFAGIIKAELTSAELGPALQCLNLSGIGLSDIRYLDEMTCTFYFYSKDLPKLNHICKKRGEAVRILQRKGVWWSFWKIPDRPLLLIGIPFLLAATLLLPTRIFFVKVDGNKSIPSKQILSAAEACGICFGVSRQQVRSEKVKNALLHTLPQLQWAGVNTSGCVATISVREGAAAEEGLTSYGVSNIVAIRDGFIISGTATRGTVKFQVGQAVKAGQILISGYADHGICIQGTRAEGEVFAQTQHNFTAVTPRSYGYRNQEGGRKYKISMIIRKKRINLWKDSGISGSSCDRMYQEYYLTLPGGFVLPFALCIETYTDYAVQNISRPYKDICTGLERFADLYLQQQMVAGRILEREQTVSPAAGVCCLTGTYDCIEMIGREQHEQIGEQHGKSS